MTPPSISRVIPNVAAAWCAWALLVHAGPQSLTFTPAEVYAVDPQDYNAAGQPSFPETTLLGDQAKSIGVALSGGGTRSATASLGALRGLQANGWLDRVMYIAATSGGTWSAVPYVYGTNPASLDELIGTPVTPDKLTLAVLGKTEPGSIAYSIEHSGFAASIVREVVGFSPDLLLRGQIKQLAGLLAKFVRPDEGRIDKSYTHLLGSAFIDPHIPNGRTRPFAWDYASLVAMATRTHQDPTAFVHVREKRPFLIVTGTLINERPDYDQPMLAQVEYTPLYIGVRQQFGSRIGGGYISPSAYDAAYVRRQPDSATIETAPRASGPLTLADIIASSGAAPQLWLRLAENVPEAAARPIRRFADAFPAFNHVAIRNGIPQAPMAGLLHGDGGFMDNLSIMPLLARQVKNILVFVNSKNEYNDNDDLAPYFVRVTRTEGGHDRSHNAVFPAGELSRMMDTFAKQRKAGDPLIFCSGEGGWKVEKNQYFNIRGYSGLNICWIHNAAVAKFENQLAKDTLGSLTHAREQAAKYRTEKLGSVKKLIERDHDFREFGDFPLYATFFQNKPHFVKMDAAQVNLLAELAAWTVTNADSRKKIEDAFGAALK